MLLIPMQSSDHKNDIMIVVLDDIGLQRIQQADPAEIPLSKTGKTLVNPLILICHESDHSSLNKYIQRNDIQGLIKHLQRGWKFQPELGDNDRGPESIKDSN